MTETDQKAQQADFYDKGVDAEFEINRPHGQGRLYNHLMNYKFDRVRRMIDTDLTGKTVLDICCGSGMDAEYLARAGADVTALDISPGAVERARTRASRFGVQYHTLVGDAEALPFDAESFDYVFVHDGLHHLSEPHRAIREMGRVARLGIVITEPAQAALTHLLIRLRIMKPYEDAGNFVIRFNAAELKSLATESGFPRVHVARYLVKYGHPPPAWWRAFDVPPLFALATAIFHVAGVALFGRIGNKIAFVAQRSTGIAADTS